MNRVRQLSNATKLNIAGLVLTAAGMLLQIAAGSKLYPSVAGPIVLLAAGVIVAFWSSRSTPYAGLLVPLVLGLAALQRHADERAQALAASWIAARSGREDQAG